MNDNTNGAKLKSAPLPSADPSKNGPIDHAISADASDQTSDAPADEPANASPDETADTTADDERDDSGDEQDSEKRDGAGGRAQRRLSISVSARSLVYAALIAVVVGVLATFVWRYIDARRELDAQARQSANNVHAEKVALDYAVNAAAMNYKDLSGWQTKLVGGTSPELTDKLTKAAESVQQILIPLQWNSTAQPLVAKVRSNTAGIYVVDCFVSVQTKTVQAPDPLLSTATYSLTLDSNNNWQITDVGGIGALVGQK